MLLKIAQETFESYKKLRQLALDTETKYFSTADEIDEKLGFVTDSVIHRIMYCLKIDGIEECGYDYYGVILDCIQDDDTFEYMIRALGLEELVEE